MRTGNGITLSCALAAVLTAALLPAMSVNAFAAASISDENMAVMSDSIEIEGIEGQEYIVAEKGKEITEDSWKDAVTPEAENDLRVRFTDLVPATEYEIYTRIKDAASDEDKEPAKIEVITLLIGAGITGDGYYAGVEMTVIPDPEDTTGLSYQWCHDEMEAVEGGAYKHTYTDIEGASSATYVVKKEDVGKRLAVKIFKGGKEIMVIDDLGPVEAEAPIRHDNCKKDEKCPLSGFRDLDPARWYHDGIHYCLEFEYMGGTSKDTFAPEGVITRAQAATILYAMNSRPEVTAKNTFPDIPEKSWYTAAVTWAAQEKIVAGYADGNFGPEDKVTREQLALMLYKLAEKWEMDITAGENTNILSYEDAGDISAWAKTAMQWAVGKGVMSGKGAAIDPRGETTRAEAAVMIMGLE